MFRGKRIEKRGQIALNQLIPENLHISHIAENGVSEHGGHGGDPRFPAGSSVCEKRFGENTGLIFDEDFELFIFDRFGYG